MSGALDICALALQHPPMPFIRVLSLALVPMLTAALAAQTVASIGRFVDADGAPIAGATVTFATGPADVFDAFAPARLVTATTSSDGRFRAELRAGEMYSVWAIGPADAAGRQHSPAQDCVRAGDVVTLRAAPRFAPRPLRIESIADFGPGPFSIEVRGAALHGPVHRIPLAADGSATLPALPAGLFAARMVAADGRVVLADVRGLPSGNATQPRRRVLVEVVDTAGAPVVGARVAMLTSNFVQGEADLHPGVRHLPARVEGPLTDAHGRSEMLVAELSHAFCAWTDELHTRVARQDQLQSIVDGVLQQRQPPAADAAAAPCVRLIARPDRTLRVALRDGGRPLAHHGVIVRTAVRCATEAADFSASTGFGDELVGRTDQDGVFLAKGLPRPIGSLQLCFEGLGERAFLAMPRADVPEESLTLDLGTWPVTTLQ